MPDILKRISRVNKLFLILIVFYIAAALALGLSGVLDLLPQSLMMVMGEILVGIPALGYCLMFRERPFAGRYSDRLRVSTGLLLALLGVAILPMVWFLNSLTVLVTPNYVAGTMVETQSNPLWLNLLLIGVVPAVVEETIFRGIFYQTYSWKNPVRAMVLSGLLFALVHLNLNQIAYALPLGILLAFVMEVTGSFLAPMILHFTINGVNTVFAWVSLSLLGDGLSEEVVIEASQATIPFASYVFMFCLALVSAGAFVGLMWAIACSCRRKGWMKDLLRGRAPVLVVAEGAPVSRRLGDVFLWIGVVIALVYSVL